MNKKKILVTRSSMPTYDEYCQAIKPLWDTHWLTNMGHYHKQLEDELKEYLDVPELSLMVNGHMSLEMAIQAFGFPEGSEVITTPFTFISTTHAIVRNHLQPVFCDVKSSNGTIDEEKIEDLITEKTVAIVAVHVYGHMCNVERIQEIADKYNLKVVYDAAHTFGVKYKGKGAGAFGDASIFSFHATKVFNTIEGGAVCCPQHWLYEKLYNLKNFGIHGEELVSDIGANAKMNEFCAIMGLCNLKHLDVAIEARKQAYENYMNCLSDSKNIIFFSESDDVTKNYAYFPVLFVNKACRDSIYDALKTDEIFSRKYFYPLTSDQACFKNKYKKCQLDVARDLADRVLVLPMFEGLGKVDIERICKIIKY